MRTSPNFRPPYQPSLYPEPWTWLWLRLRPRKHWCQVVSSLQTHVVLISVKHFSLQIYVNDIHKGNARTKTTHEKCQNQLSLHCIHFPKCIEWPDLDLHTIQLSSHTCFFIHLYSSQVSFQSDDFTYQLTVAHSYLITNNENHIYNIYTSHTKSRRAQGEEID